MCCGWSASRRCEEFFVGRGREIVAERRWEGAETLVLEVMDDDEGVWSFGWGAGRRAEGAGGAGAVVERGDAGASRRGGCEAAVSAGGVPVDARVVREGA